MRKSRANKEFCMLEISYNCYLLPLVGYDLLFILLPEIHRTTWKNLIHNLDLRKKELITASESFVVNVSFFALYFSLWPCITHVIQKCRMYVVYIVYIIFEWVLTTYSVNFVWKSQILRLITLSDINSCTMFIYLCWPCSTVAAE